MNKHPLDKKVAEELFENNKPDIFGLAGKDLPVVISATAFTDQGGHLTVRLQTQTGVADPEFNFSITPYAAVRLAHALAELVNHNGQMKVEMSVTDPDRGLMAKVR